LQKIIWQPGSNFYREEGNKIVTKLWLDDWKSIPGRDTFLFLIHQVHTRFWNIATPDSISTMGCFLRCKATGAWSWSILPPSVWVKNGRSCPSQSSGAMQKESLLQKLQPSHLDWHQGTGWRFIITVKSPHRHHTWPSCVFHTAESYILIK
jgi:hypothetical protein